MKKYLLILLIIFLVGAGFLLQERIDKLGNDLASQISNKLPGLEEVVYDISQKQEVDATIEKIKKEIRTPEPLRQLLDNPASFLTETGTIEATNLQRVAQGLAPLKANALLNEAARQKVQDMFQDQYFEHISPQGVNPGDLIEAAGYEFIKIGENLALGNYADDADLVRAWMDSPPHRENILMPDYTEIGIAVGQGVFEGETTWLAVQEFGRPLSLCPSVEKTLAGRIDVNQASLDSLGSRVQKQLVMLDSEKPQGDVTQEEADAYNSQVAEYNRLVKEYDQQADKLKALVAEYNIQVKAFNNCLSE